MTGAKLERLAIVWVVLISARTQCLPAILLERQPATTTSSVRTDVYITTCGDQPFRLIQRQSFSSDSIRRVLGEYGPFTSLHFSSRHCKRSARRSKQP